MSILEIELTQIDKRSIQMRQSLEQFERVVARPAIKVKDVCCIWLDSSRSMNNQFQ